MAYRAIVGFNYPDGKGGEIRVEAGTVLDSLPETHAAAILELECVEEIPEAPPEAQLKKERK